VATSVQLTLAQVLGIALSTQKQSGLVSTPSRSLYSSAGKASGEACSGGISKPVSRQGRADDSASTTSRIRSRESQNVERMMPPMRCE